MAGRRRPAPSARFSPERIAELEATIEELRRRQDAQPKAEVVRRMRLALLIQAFERTLERCRDGLKA